MTTESNYISESGISFDNDALLRAAKAAARESWLAEIEAYFRDQSPEFSFRFFEGSRLFGYPGAERDALLRVLASCLRPRRGTTTGKATFEYAGVEAEVRIDYRKKSLGLYTRRGRGWVQEPTRQARIPENIAEAIRGKPEKTARKKKKTPKVYAPGRAHEFRSSKGKTVYLGYRSRSFERWLKPAKYFKCVRVWCSKLPARWVFQSAANDLLERGFEYTGHRPYPSDSAIDWKTLERMDCTCAKMPHQASCPVLKIRMG
jgi:hypothetical protein